MHHIFKSQPRAQAPLPHQMDMVGPHRISIAPPAERRSQRGSLFQTVARAIQRLDPEVRRANKQERAAWKAFDQHLSSVIKAVSVGDAHTSRVLQGAKGAEALQALDPSNAALSEATIQRRGAHVLHQVSQLDAQKLAYLDNYLDTYLDSTPTTDALLLQLRTSVKSEALRRSMEKLEFTDAASWSARSVHLDLQPLARLRQLYDLSGLAALNINEFDENSPDETVLPGTRYTYGDLKQIHEYAERGKDALLRHASKAASTSQAGLDRLSRDDLLKHKYLVDFLVQMSLVPDAKLQARQTNLENRIKVSHQQVVEPVLGKQPLDVAGLSDAALMRLAGEVAKLESDLQPELPTSVTDARSKIDAAIAQRKKDAQADFQSSLKLAVRAMGSNDGPRKLLNYATTAEATEKRLLTLNGQFQQEVNGWIRAVIDNELKLGERGEANLKRFHGFIKTGEGNAIRGRMSSTGNLEIGHLMRLDTAFSTAFPEGRASSKVATH